MFSQAAIPFSLRRYHSGYRPWLGYGCPLGTCPGSFSGWPFLGPIFESEKGPLSAAFWGSQGSLTQPSGAQSLTTTCMLIHSEPAHPPISQPLGLWFLTKLSRVPHRSSCPLSGVSVALGTWTTLRKRLGLKFKASGQASEEWVGLGGGDSSQGKDNREIPGEISEVRL